MNQTCTTNCRPDQSSHTTSEFVWTEEMVMRLSQLLHERLWAIREECEKKYPANLIKMNASFRRRSKSYCQRGGLMLHQLEDSNHIEFFRCSLAFPDSIPVDYELDLDSMVFVSRNLAEKVLALGAFP